uniref:Uncharacterized protein n=1 Tax=Molossus molossus TaxID=27622 RepID=A0A7J8FZC1_MOLMO|nr:hypothetical protein HJG59_008270 [Molossus molossus]
MALVTHGTDPRAPERSNSRDGSKGRTVAGRGIEWPLPGLPCLPFFLTMTVTTAEKFWFLVTVCSPRPHEARLRDGPTSSSLPRGLLCDSAPNRPTRAGVLLWSWERILSDVPAFPGPGLPEGRDRVFSPVCLPPNLVYSLCPERCTMLQVSLRSVTGQPARHK